ncbi:MAG: hypothetical protein KBA61_14260 [Spirochaetes bacterium]|jgi:hypothetical protein|nr:hypothetical protein [Spirochaetota bacterium]HPA70760.1 hypothetical protein [Spirochaetota bacterium]
MINGKGVAFVACIALIVGSLWIASSAQETAMSRRDCMTKASSDYNMRALECRKASNAKCPRDNKCYQKELKECTAKARAEMMAAEKKCPKR